MIEALRRPRRETREPICYIISGDLAHIGPKFGDPRAGRRSRTRPTAGIRTRPSDAGGRGGRPGGYFRVIAEEDDAAASAACRRRTLCWRRSARRGQAAALRPVRPPAGLRERQLRQRWPLLPMNGAVPVCAQTTDLSHFAQTTAAAPRPTLHGTSLQTGIIESAAPTPLGESLARFAREAHADEFDTGRYRMPLLCLGPRSAACLYPRPRRLRPFLLPVIARLADRSAASPTICRRRGGRRQARANPPRRSRADLFALLDHLASGSLPLWCVFRRNCGAGRPPRSPRRFLRAALQSSFAYRPLAPMERCWPAWLATGRAGWASCAFPQPAAGRHRRFRRRPRDGRVSTSQHGGHAGAGFRPPGCAHGAAGPAGATAGGTAPDLAAVGRTGFHHQPEMRRGVGLRTAARRPARIPRVRPLLRNIPTPQVSPRLPPLPAAALWVDGLTPACGFALGCRPAFASTAGWQPSAKPQAGLEGRYFTVRLPR